MQNSICHHRLCSQVLLYCDMTIILSGDAISETVSDSDTSIWAGSAAAGREIPITNSYSSITSIQLALQSVGAGYTWEVVSKVAATPKIKIYDNTGTATDATVDVEVKGYPVAS